MSQKSTEPHVTDTQVTDYRLVLAAARTKGNAVVEIGIFDLDGILADLEGARAALRAIEWVQPEAFLHYRSYCPECGNYQTTGHKSDCLIGKALAATEVNRE